MPESHAVFTEQRVLEKLIADIDAARALVRIQSPFITRRRIERLQPALIAATRRRVCVCVYLQTPTSLFMPAEESQHRREPFDACVALLRASGVHVSLRDHMHQKVVIVDDSILWDGSLNFLSHLNTTERVTRWVSREKVREALILHGLNACDECVATSTGSNILAAQPAPLGRCADRRVIGTFLEQKRKSLGWTQLELAKRSGVRQYMISKLERGEQDVRLSTLTRVTESLGCGLRVLDWYLLPTTDSIARDNTRP